MILFLFYLLYDLKYKIQEKFTDNENYTAIIVEPRKHKSLELVLQRGLF
jgi:hypothetical protein